MFALLKVKKVSKLWIIAGLGAVALMAAAGDFRKPGTDIYGKGYVPGL